MDKMKMQSVNLTDANIDKIAALFPNCITETADENGKLKKAINFDMLRAMLSEDIAEGDEAYEFTWVGKKAAIAEANRPIRKTLRPCVEESVNWDTTENLYIEGDNLEVLKLLQESYLGKVKMIYIDPPYNTGNDFIYRDDFAMSSDEYAEESGQLDDEGNRLFKNTDSNGRFHSDWCSMIYSRLMLARNLLSDDGVVFISIDDHEQDNLKKLCNEIFGEENFIAQVIWERAFSPVNLKKHFSESHDYILCYCKQIDNLVCNGLPRNNESDGRYSNPDNDIRGPWTSGDLSVGPAVADRIYEIITPSGRRVLPPSGYCWRLDKKTFEQYKADNRIWFGETGNNVPRIKRFLSEVKQGITPMTIWKYTDVGSSQDATKQVKHIFDNTACFTYPKPLELIKRCLNLYTDRDSVIVDFFSGSATTAHAVMQLNAEDGGHRKFIMVQLPEETDEKSEAYKAGYKNICEIGKERIRRAGAKINAELSGKDGDNNSELCIPNSDLDIGFRVLKLDSSNMQDVYYSPAETSQQMLLNFESNIKEDRTDLDLLFGCLLDWGLPLSMPYKSEQIDGVTVHTYNDGDLIACFDKDISENVVKEIAKHKPLRVVFRDDSFADSPAKINVEEIFKLLSPDTRVKVI